MSMLHDFIRAAAYIVVLGMAAAVGYRLMHVAVRCRGLLTASDGGPSAGAMPLLLATVGGAIYITAHAAGGAGSLTIPSGYLYLLGGSSMIQLASRTRVVWRPRSFPLVRNLEE